MQILMVSAECAPIAKAGGLGDFVHGLSRALIAAGQQVQLVLPRYEVLRLAGLPDPEPWISDLRVPFGGESQQCAVDRLVVEGIPCLLINPLEADCFRRGVIYGQPDDARRFAFFSVAVVELIRQSKLQPDIIHCNDWHSGLVPVLLRSQAASSDAGLSEMPLCNTPCCYTVHNFGHQGWAPRAVLDEAGLDAAALMRPELLQSGDNPDEANLMQGGIAFADVVITVSPRHAWEVQFTEQGMGLQSKLQALGARFAGILNGIDEEVWHPRHDRLIPHAFDAQQLLGKAMNTQALRHRFGLAECHKPVVAVVSRLDRQKGVALIRHGIRYALAQGAQLVLLGSAQDPAINAEFCVLAEELGDNPDAHLHLGYDEASAHLIFAGADLILIPSLYEPCGLTQMIAMNYGCLPVVRRVGGLADTVVDVHFSDRPADERNGFVFDDPTPEALELALGRAIRLWREQPDDFRTFRLNAMRAERSWQAPARQYMSIYEAIKAVQLDA